MIWWWYPQNEKWLVKRTPFPHKLPYQSKINKANLWEKDDLFELNDEAAVDAKFWMEWLLQLWTIYLILVVIYPLPRILVCMVFRKIFKSSPINPLSKHTIGISHLYYAHRTQNDLRDEYRQQHHEILKSLGKNMAIFVKLFSYHC